MRLLDTTQQSPTRIMGDRIMQNITLDFHIQARVWLQEHPQIIYSATDLIEREVGSGLEKKAGDKRAALEILIPVGPRFLYGLLGAKFIPNDSGKIVVQILVSTTEEADYKKSIASEQHLDTVRVGLPREYSNSVIEGALQALNPQSCTELGSGILRFDQAAWGEIGSSNKIFRQIAATVVQLLALNSDKNQTQLTEIIKAYTYN